MATIQHSQSTLADAAEARTTVPAAAPGAGRLEDTGHDHDDHGHDHEDHGHEDHDHAFEWPEIVRIAVVAVAAVAVWFRVWEPIPAVSVIGVAGLLLGGWPILKEAFENLLERRMTMELSMTIAIASPITK